MALNCSFKKITIKPNKKFNEINNEMNKLTMKIICTI